MVHLEMFVLKLSYLFACLFQVFHPKHLCSSVQCSSCSVNVPRGSTCGVHPCLPGEATVESIWWCLQRKNKCCRFERNCICILRWGLLMEGKDHWIFFIKKRSEVQLSFQLWSHKLNYSSPISPAPWDFLTSLFLQGSAGFTADASFVPKTLIFK